MVLSGVAVLGGLLLTLVALIDVFWVELIVFKLCKFIGYLSSLVFIGRSALVIIHGRLVLLSLATVIEHALD